MVMTCNFLSLIKVTLAEKMIKRHVSHWKVLTGKSFWNQSWNVFTCRMFSIGLKDWLNAHTWTTHHLVTWPSASWRSLSFVILRIRGSTCLMMSWWDQVTGSLILHHAARSRRGGAYNVRSSVRGGARGVTGLVCPHPLGVSQGCDLLLCCLSLQLQAVSMSSLQPQRFIQNTDRSVLQFYLIHLHTQGETHT